MTASLPPEAEAWYAAHGMLETMRGHLASGDPSRVGMALSRWELPPPGAPGPPPTAAGTPVGLAVHAHLYGHGGYGQVAEHVGRGLEALGVAVGYVPLSVDESFLPMGDFVGSRIAPGATSPVTLRIDRPGGTPTSADAVALTMWESTRIPASDAAALNRFRAVVLPSAWNAEGFRASGVTVPVHVVPLGVAACEGYTPKPHREGGPFTVGMAARTPHGGIRKGLNEGIAAFLAAFPSDPDVRLAIKCWPDCLARLRLPDDPRVKAITDSLSTQGLADWYAGLDVLLVPSKGEGWGLHTLQAMACGRPVLAARYGGTAEFFDGSCGWELPYVEAPAGEFYSGLGSWAVPIHAGMVEALRLARADPEARRAKGDVAAERARAFPWSRTAKALLDVLVEAGLPDPKEVRRAGKRRGSLAEILARGPAPAPGRR